MLSKELLQYMSGIDKQTQAKELKKTPEQQKTPLYYLILKTGCKK